MRLLGNIMRSVWTWLLIIGAICYFIMQSTNGKAVTEQNIDLGTLEIPKSTFVLTTQGIVEIEGGIIKVSASRTGTFKDVYVKEGDFVKKGDLLALQEDRDDKIAIRRAQIAIENAKIQEEQESLSLTIKKRELERAKIQFDQDAISQQQYDSAKDSLENGILSKARLKLTHQNLKTDLETAQFNLSQRRLISPSDGRVLSTAVTAGAGVSAENVSTAFTIIPNSPKRVRVKVDKYGIDKVYENQSVIIKSTSNSTNEYAGKVISIGDVFSAASSSKNSALNTVDIIIDVTNLPYRLGENVIVQFENKDAARQQDTYNE